MRFISALLALLQLLLLAMIIQRSAVAQVPPHQPGTICFTPGFWCWMPYPTYPGTFCVCGNTPGRTG